MQSARRTSLRGRALALMLVTAAAAFVPLTASPATAAGSGSVSLTALDVAYAQDLNTLANVPATTANTVLPTGWYLTESGGGTRDNEAYATGTGSSNTGDTYSFGVDNVAERAFGALRSGTLVPIIGTSFTNNTGSPVSSLDIGYVGEQWRLGTAGREDRIDFQYSVDATSLTTGTWTDVDALDFSSPSTAGTVGLRDGNAAANQAAISGSVGGLSIADSQSFWIRWSDFDASGADDGLAVDDFSLTPRFVDSAPSVVATSPLAGAVNVALNANVSATFSEPVNVAGAWFSISCTTSGSHTASVSGGPTTFSLDPDVDFAINETCTVTVFASQVTDQDADDPPDNMAGDAVFSFTTADPVVCGAPATLIHEIQGSASTAALTGVRTVEGVVVGDYQGAGQFGGYFLQEEDSDADANPLTSEGIFVFNTSTSVSLGDRVRVQGYRRLTSPPRTDADTDHNVTATEVCGAGCSVTPLGGTARGWVRTWSATRA